jgi:hypothetical protein
MKPIHVLLGPDSQHHLGLVQGVGQWKLNEDSVNLRVFVELLHPLQELAL